MPDEALFLAELALLVLPSGPTDDEDLTSDEEAPLLLLAASLLLWVVSEDPSGPIFCSSLLALWDAALLAEALLWDELALRRDPSALIVSVAADLSSEAPLEDEAA